MEPLVLAEDILIALVKLRKWTVPPKSHIYEFIDIFQVMNIGDFDPFFWLLKVSSCERFSAVNLMKWNFEPDIQFIFHSTDSQTENWSWIPPTYSYKWDGRTNIIEILLSNIASITSIIVILPSNITSITSIIVILPGKAKCGKMHFLQTYLVKAFQPALPHSYSHIRKIMLNVASISWNLGALLELFLECLIFCTF